MKISHSLMVATLAKSGEVIAAEMTAADAHALHMAVGISGEVGELAENVLLSLGRENAVEELGDIEFYFEGLCQGYEVKIVPRPEPEDWASRPSRSYLLPLVVSAASLLDVVKKQVVYRKAIDPEVMRESIVAVRHALDDIYLHMGATRAEAFEANIAKLGERYEGFKYSDQAAQDRADKQ